MKRLLAALVILGVTSRAAAASPSPTVTTGGQSSSVSVQVRPIFGADAASGYGWTEFVAEIDNAGAGPVKGNLELSSKLAYTDDQELTTRAPFSVQGGRSVLVHLSVHGYPFRPSTVVLTARDERGEVLGSRTLSPNGTVAPLLVDVDEPSRLAVALRNAAVPLTWNPVAFGTSPTAPTLTVGVPMFDRATGDPVLPEHPAGYASASVVLVHTDTLARLDASQLDSLVDWVLAGGTLAAIPTRPEDLRGPTLSALVGGTITPGEPPPVLLTLPGVGDPAPLNPLPMLPHGLPQPLPIGPSQATRPHLVGYTGGNLQPSHFGASAPYGLGEVHLLAFDPTQVPMIDDPWVQARMAELAGRAWDRRAVNAFRQGSLPQTPYELNDVRRSLDPNENFRPALGIAAILLVLYSIVSGPVTFLRAAKLGKPLSPLKWAPLWSAIAFTSIVLIGLAGKGWRGRARHLSLIEAGAGVSRGAIRRYRGFFTSEARSVSIKSTDSTCVLDVTGEDVGRQPHILRIDRNGAAIEGLTSLPWQTVVVVEDGAFELGGGVAILPTPDGSADVVNRTGRRLRDVFVYLPGKALTYFPDLPDGGRVHASSGLPASAAHTRRTVSAGSRAVHPLDVADLISSFDKARSSLLVTWQPLEAAAGDQVDWWPDDAPVVLAELIGGEGRTNDSGLSIESDRTLVRIVGAGGTP